MYLESKTIVSVFVVCSLVLCSCVSNKPKTNIVSAPVLTEKQIKEERVSALPRAIVYRTNADYSNNVPITLSNDGHKVVSFPAPTDVTTSKPVALNGGYWLDQRGVNRNTAFLDYTYEEYAQLKSPPSADELLQHVLARNVIIEMYALPITANEALKDIKRCNSFVDCGFQGCEKLLFFCTITTSPQ